MSIDQLTDSMGKMSLNPVAAPKSLRYEPDAGLPVAIEAHAQRRTFRPDNGTEFGPGKNKVLRLTLNSENFVDFSHSYFQFKYKNESGSTVGLDDGTPFFSRLQIMSGGKEIEDLQA
eukprot:COSAG06_NODE_2243_length_7267_cov_3.942662_5_plen_116_part_01